MIQLRGNRIAIEKIKKQTKNTTNGFLVMPDSEEYLGIIKFIGESSATDLEVGQKVYFSTKFQHVKIQGTDLCIMDDTEVYAIEK